MRDTYHRDVFVDEFQWIAVYGIVRKAIGWEGRFGSQGQLHARAHARRLGWCKQLAKHTDVTYTVIKKTCVVAHRVQARCWPGTNTEQLRRHSQLQLHNEARRNK
jgi:hypothetical protein